MYKNNYFINLTFPFAKLIGRNSNIIAANINSTEPSFDSKIKLGTNLLKINYAVPISSSTQNITIYQVYGTNVVMRQTRPGQLCSVDSDHNSISLEMLPSTFNSPNSEYYVSIDSNFVKSEINDEPILGLEPAIWKLYTGIYSFYYTFTYFHNKIKKNTTNHRW